MKIYIDVGHGETGSDSGALGSIPDRRIVLREKEQNLIIALSAQKTLLAAGHSVTLSRTKNTNITTPIGKTISKHKKKTFSRYMAPNNMNAPPIITCFLTAFSPLNAAKISTAPATNKHPAVFVNCGNT